MRISIIATRDGIIKAAFFIGLLALGLGVIGFAARDYDRARASIAWPTVDGVITGAATGSSTTLRYAYNWRGRNYESARVRFTTAAFSAMPDSLVTLKQGSITTVYVSPQDPSVAVLSPGGVYWAFLMMVGGGGLLCFIGFGGLARAVSTIGGAQ